VIGTTIGNYVVRDKIGEGGMGVVYVAEHPRIGRKVAIKVLLPEFSQNPEVVERFFTEARASSAIKNEHIIDIIDFGELADGSSYIIMEWLEGTPLTTALERDKRFTIERALHVARGIGRALAAAHNRGIVHRDLKPDNVFLVPRADNPEFVKVLDFGIAKLMGNEGGGSGPRASKTRTGAIIGTPTYMSPEQCRGVSVDERSDIYALAVIVYQMLSGKVPFESEGLGELLLKHMTETPTALRELLPGIPENVERAVARAMEKDPDKRFRRVEDFVAELGGQPTTEIRVGVPTASMRAPAPASAVHAASTATDTIGAAAGETIAPRGPEPRRSNAMWFLLPLLIGGSAAAIMLPRLLGNGGEQKGDVSQGEPRPAAQAKVEPAAPAPQPKAPPAPARVRFEVRSAAAGAQLFVDGKTVPNPYGEDLPADGRVYDVRIEAPGFLPFHDKITLNGPQTVAPVLVADAHKGQDKKNTDHGGHRLPAAPPTPPEAIAKKTEARSEAKSDAPKVEGKDEKTPIYKGTKGKLITEFPPE
jgi:hypothetical protein